MYVWGLVDYTPCDHWIEGYLIDGGNRIVLDPSTYIYGDSSSSISDSPCCQVAQIRISSQGVFEVMDDTPISFRFDNEYALIYERPAVCEENDICSLGTLVNTSDASQSNVADKKLVYDEVRLEVRRPQLFRNGDGLFWEKTDLIYRNDKKESSTLEAFYAFSGEDFYLRIGGNIMTGKIKEHSIVFNYPQTTCPGLDISSLNELYGMDNVQKSLGLENFTGEKSSFRGDMFFKFWLYKAQYRDVPCEYDPYMDDRIIISEYLPRIEFGGENEDLNYIKFKERHDGFNDINRAERFGLPEVLIKNTSGFPIIKEEPTVYNDPYDPLIQGAWNYVLFLTSHTYKYRTMEFHPNGDYEKIEGEIHPSSPAYNYEITLEKGFWETDQGTLIVSYREVDRNDPDKFVDEDYDVRTYEYRIVSGYPIFGDRAAIGSYSKY